MLVKFEAGLLWGPRLGVSSSGRIVWDSFSFVEDKDSSREMNIPLPIKGKDPFLRIRKRMWHRGPRGNKAKMVDERESRPLNARLPLRKSISPVIKAVSSNPKGN